MAKDKKFLPLLNDTARSSLEKYVSKGVPVCAAGGILGYVPKTIQAWMHLGISLMHNPPSKPGSKDTPNVMYFDGADMPYKLWYNHATNCIALAAHTMGLEGKLVGGLVRRLWKAAKADTDVMKFLFKQYGHVHTLGEENKQTVTVQGPNDEDGVPTKPTLVLYLPHNGREDPAVPIGKKT